MQRRRNKCVPTPKGEKKNLKKRVLFLFLFGNTHFSFCAAKLAYRKEDTRSSACREVSHARPPFGFFLFLFFFDTPPPLSLYSKLLLHNDHLEQQRGGAVTEMEGVGKKIREEATELE